MTATRIIIIGDAISRGSARDVSGALPATIRPSYRYWLWKLLREKGRDVDFVGPQTAPDFPADQFEFDQDNAAYGGDTTTAVLSETVRNLSADLAPHVAILFEGTEDAFKQIPVSESGANVRGQITDLRAAYTAAYGAVGMAVVVVQLPPTSDGENGKYRDRTRIVPLNTTIAEVAAQMTTAAEPVIAVDCHTGFTSEMTDDGLKPNELGEQFIAGQLFLALAPLIGGVSPTVPTTPPGEDPPDYNAGDIVAEFKASTEEGSYPLAVTFTDRSTVDRKKLRIAVIATDARLIPFMAEVVKFLPADLLSLDVGQGVGTAPTNYSLTTINTTIGPITVPWPTGTETAIVSMREMAGAAWGGANGCAAGANQGTDRRIAVSVTEAELEAGDYDHVALRFLHECLHTIEGLESSDAMRTSEAFLAWLVDHPSTIATGFAKAPATYGVGDATIEDQLQGLFYAYLVERYRVHPTLNSGQVTYAWTFGDGGISTDRSPSHTYVSAGSYPVVLTVTSPWGTDASTATTITVHEPTVPPTAAFTVTATRGEVPFGIQFFDRSTGGTPDRWLWDFGDGTTSDLQHPTHVYTAPGVYSPSLTLSNDGGASAYESPNMITALRPPQPAPAVHELSRAGYLDLMSMLAEAFAWVELRDGAGLPISPRINTAGRIAWTVDDESTQVYLVVRILGTDAPALPQMLTGVAFYDDAFFGDPLTVETFPGGISEWPVLTMSADTLDVTVHVNVIAESVIPRIIDLVSANVSGEAGTAMIINFRVVNVPGTGYTVVCDSLPAVVQAGSMARIPLRVVKS